MKDNLFNRFSPFFVCFSTMSRFKTLYAVKLLQLICSSDLISFLAKSSPNPYSPLLYLTCAEAVLGARSAVSRAAVAFSVCGVIPLQTLRSAGVVLQQVLLLAAETVGGIPLTGRTLGGTRLAHPTFGKPSNKIQRLANIHKCCTVLSRNEIKTSVAPLTCLHTHPVVQVEAAATALTPLVSLTHVAAPGAFCTAARRLIGEGSQRTASCAGLLGSQEKT